VERLLDTSRGDVWVAHLLGSNFFETPWDGAEFALMLVVADEGVSKDDRNAWCSQIVARGCRYAVCTGLGRETWHDTLDESYVASDPNFHPPPERFMMTTWHENESLEDVARFFSPDHRSL
jgi:hypothetical protein